jgi:hypothetical protein
MTPEEYFRKNPPRVSNPRSGVDPRLSVYEEDGRLFTDPMESISKQQSMYVFGGGTIGGDIWNYRQPTTMERVMGRNEPMPELKPEFRGSPTSTQDWMSGAAERRKIDLVPVVAGQEFWNSPEGRRIKQRGRHTKTPERFERGTGKNQGDREEQFYSTVTGRPMGTLMGTGGYGGFGGDGPQSSQRSWDNYVERVGPRNPDYIARSGFKSMDSGGGTQVGGPQPEQKPAPQRTPTPRIPPMPVGSYMSDQYGFGYSSQPMGFSGAEAAFTPAGSAIGMRPSPTATSTPPPFPELPDYSSLTGFGGYPMFPYANY